MSEWGDDGTCDICGKENVPVYYGPDPYVNEIYPEDNPEYEWWCEECFDGRSMDI